MRRAAALAGSSHTGVALARAVLAAQPLSALSDPRNVRAGYGACERRRLDPAGRAGPLNAVQDGARRAAASYSLISSSFLLVPAAASEARQ